MEITKKLAIITLASSVSISALATRALAQEVGGVTTQPFALAASSHEANSAQTSGAQASNSTVTDPANGWHFSVTPYLWFAGMHGTLGAKGHDVSVHAGFSDIFSYLNIGLMGAIEPRYKKFGAPVDFLWMKLSDDKGLPFERGPTSIKAKVTQTLLAPKVSYRLIDGEMVKVDGNFGIRYFHLGTTVTLEPASRLPSFYQSANWVDYTGGARIVATVSPRILVTALGDVGAGGADLDYQVAGALGYKLKPSIVLQTGWRYLDVNYRPKSTFVYDTATTGLIVGATFYLK